jgi:AraC-like DNA-binding protein
LHHPGIRLAELARKLSMSESHLRSRFREGTGLSIGRYLRKMRLRRAANWIEEEGLSVKCVSERAGYPYTQPLVQPTFRPPPLQRCGKSPVFFQLLFPYKMTGGDPVARHDNHDEILKCANAWT